MIARLSFFLLAGLIGGAVGVITLALMQLILIVQWLGYGAASEIEYAAIAADAPAWRLLAATTLGGLAVGILMQTLPEKRYHGIADVMEACAFNSGRMPIRSGLGAGLAAGISLGAGAPLGREGPAVHIGASASAWFAERLGLGQRQSLTLLGCGAAAAVTVSFNAPIAAVIFALEVIVGYYTLRVFAPVVIAAMVAVALRHAVLGPEPMFPLPDVPLESVLELPWFALLGVIGALVARLLIALVSLTDRGWRLTPVPSWLRPAIAGLLIGAIALELPMILSVGFEPTLLALQGDLGPGLLLALLVAKLGGVALALGSGFAGGVFSPAMFLGAMLGGSFWFVLQWLPISISALPIYALGGMAGMVSALLGAPISTILIVFEMTRDYGATLGVMTAAACASTTMQFGRHASFFRWQLAGRDVNLATGRNISLLMTERIERFANDRFLAVRDVPAIGELASRLGREARQVAVLVDDADCLVGSIGLAQLLTHGYRDGMDTPLDAVMMPSGFVVTASTNIVSAMQTMAEREVEFVPVVDDERRVLGIVRRGDLLHAHYDLVKRARDEEFGIA